MGDSLGDRMKCYENVSRQSLTRRTPVIIRVDGKAFHTLTRGMDRPWDARLVGWMHEAALSMCTHIQGARLAYVQSDEISVLLVDYQSLETQAWLDNGIQKMASVSASIATMAFNRADGSPGNALFDSRVFNLPREEVTNYFIWRQQDATRNSIEMLGQAHFSHKQLHGVNCDQIQEKLWQEHGINWNDTPTWLKRGACVVRETISIGDTMRSKWKVDYEIPVFTKSREYTERYVQNELSSSIEQKRNA